MKAAYLLSRDSGAGKRFYLTRANPALFCLIMLLGFGALHAQQWTYNPLPTEDWGTGVYFTDSLNGVAITWSFLGGARADIYHTSDGGYSWNSNHSHGGGLFGVTFADKKNGFAVGDNPSCGCGGIYRTTDGGRSWSLNYSSSSAQPSLYAVEFATSKIGFAGGDNSTLLRTTDGGSSWTELAGKVSGIVRDIQFVDANNGFLITARPPSSLQGERIYKTTDGGNTWTRVDLGSNFMPEAIHFVSPSVGFVVGNLGRPMILKTTDGGETWQAKYANLDNQSILLAVQFITPYVGYAAGGHINWGQGDKGIILGTKDGGETWVEEEKTLPDVIRAIHFPTQNHGFALGDGGRFMTTRRATVEGPKPAAMFNQTELDFGRLEVGESSNMMLRVQAKNQAGLTVQSVAFENAAAAAAKGFSFTAEPELPATIASGEAVFVNVRFEAKTADTAVANLVVTTNDAAGTSKVIPLRGGGGISLLPVISLSTESVAFGQVNVGAYKEMTFDISAGNAAGIRINDVALNAPGGNDHGFSFTNSDPLPIELAEGQKMTVTVRYAPEKAGTSQAFLIVGTNDPASPQKQVALAGSGQVVAGVAGSSAVAAGFSINAEPNPAVSRISLSFTLPRHEHVVVKLFSADGRSVAVLAEKNMSAGRHEIMVDMGKLPSGIYVALLKAGDVSISEKVVLNR